jgi:RNA polymerase sigma factor (sigma-70 family)
VTIPTNSSWQRDLQTIFNAGTLAGLSDGQLLERIAARRGAGGEATFEEESAFALLIDRHGPMVLRVCRGILGDPHEADDAFQATFLILLRQAGTIRKRDSVGPWLHGVTRRVAACARSAAARRRLHERRWFHCRQYAQSQASPATNTQDFDLSETIHAELDRLPERYRAPIVLCDLEERSLDEAARQLGWPLGTVKSRLNRGRERLRDRLVRRGVAPGVAGLVLSGSVAIRSAGAAIAVSPALTQVTAHLIGETATVAAGSSASVLALAKGMQKIILMSQLKMAAVALIVVGLTALGIGAMASGPRRVARDDVAANPVPAKTVTQAEKNAKKNGEKTALAPRRNLQRDDGSYIETVDITGRAADPAGRPVAGATVYVIDTNNGRYVEDNPIRSTVITGPDGRFTAAGVELLVPKIQPSPLPGVDESRFQVAGTAPGFGLTWHDEAGYRPTARPRAAKAQGGADYVEVFYSGEPVVIDLRFGPPASLRGKVIDDGGRPLAGAKVQAGLCDDPRRPHGGKSWSWTLLGATNAVPGDRRDFHGFSAMPEDLFTTRTGPDGTYGLDGLPREARLLTLIDPGPEYDPSQETVATTTKAVPNIRSLGYDAVLDHTFVAPREARFAVNYADSNQPVRGATVRIKSDRTVLRAGVAVTDTDGRTTLHLRPGEYGLAIEPPFGAPYRPTEGSLKIDKPGVSEFAAMKLEPAAIAVLEAQDASTGAGIEGVRFQYETDTTRQRRHLHSQLVFPDHPATDERGRLRAVVEPGRRRFFVATVPQGWRFEGTSSDLVELLPHREITVRFVFKKIEEPNAATVGQSTVFPQDVIEKWQRQQGLPRTGKFRTRRDFYSVRDNPIPVGELEAFLDATDLTKVSDPGAAFLARFPSLPRPYSLSRVIIDCGERLRNTATSRVETSIEVSNGLEVVAYTDANAQADIYGVHQNGRIGVLGFHNLSSVFGVPNIRRWLFKNFRGPDVSFFEGGDVKRIEAGDRMTIEQKKDHATGQWVVDLTTGFVYVHSWRSSRANVLGELIRQYGPKPFRHRLVLPSVHVEAHLQGTQVHRLELTVLEDVDLDYHPDPLDFVVAAPAGTLIIDHREDITHQKMGTAHYPVTDVIGYANGMSSRNRPIEPVLKDGQPAPPLHPATWLDQNGRTDRPDLASKVVLVDFWGIRCGPCVAQLPEVQAAADHFASKNNDFALIGLHESGATVDQVADFARKRGLTYRLAVDRPADEESWFGATFQDYGVRAIPSAAVIDRQGKVVFVGQFREALRKASELLGP